MKVRSSSTRKSQIKARPRRKTSRSSGDLGRSVESSTWPRLVRGFLVVRLVLDSRGGGAADPLGEDLVADHAQRDRGKPGPEDGGSRVGSGLGNRDGKEIRRPGQQQRGDGHDQRRDRDDDALRAHGVYKSS